MTITIINTERDNKTYTRMELDEFVGRLTKMGYERKRTSKGSSFKVKEI